MAFSKDQKEPKLPIGTDNSRSSTSFLPRYFRTSTNQKILGGTVDQLISVGDIDKVNAYIGRKTSKAYTPADNYLEDIDLSRESYQLEPSIVVKDSLENITFFKDYNDYINQLLFFNNFDIDHNLTNKQEFYSWDPHFDWDKFVNYREYYWLPTGPQSIAIKGQSKDIVSTYSVNLINDTDNFAYIFTPDGLTRNPILKLYRGQTYKFDIDCEGQPLTFKTTRTTDESFIYTNGVTSDSLYVEKGTITFTVPNNAPNLIYYVSKNDVNTSGFFNIYDLDANTEIDVEKEILGKKTYKIDSNTELSNGMKVHFLGNVTPVKYATGSWYVEGVGDAIRLVEEASLVNPGDYTFNEDIEFDSSNFDTQGFDVNSNHPVTKDYITINRASRDLNPWSRYNRWFHKSVIEASAAYNNQPAELDQNARAKRPVIEFNPDIQLWNFGTQAKKTVDLIDIFTTDVFSDVEGAYGYKIDGVTLLEGMRVLFAADTDTTVNGRIFTVGFITHLGAKRITLVEEADTTPVTGESVLINQGDFLRGKTYHYNGEIWVESQNKTAINQTPLFDVVDVNSVSFGNRTTYIGSTFLGTKLFSYQLGDTYDSVLGFNVNYQNIGNIGDIVFDFNLQKDEFSYQGEIELITRKLDRGYLKINTAIDTFRLANGWIKASFETAQPVVRQYDAVDQLNLFAIDVYANSGNLVDLEATVFVDNVKQTATQFDIYRQNGVAYIQFATDLTTNSSVIIETKSSAKKVADKGYYKFPSNLESNPQNLSLEDLTLGEISNHLKTIADHSPIFAGALPGASNLRDLGNQSSYGTQIVQHSAPLAPIIYNFTNKNVNIIKALRHANEEYSKFKRNFLRTATSYGYDGITSTHLDLILAEVAKNYTTESPYYLSDMVPFGVNFVYEQEIIDDSFTDYPLTFDFDLTQLNRKAILVYVNDALLIHGKDYIFINDSFVRITATITTGDILKIAQYENTAGCCVPPTPSKLGMYPVYEPKIYVDGTYQTPTKVIQGHDGSITVAFDDYRDDLLLELEIRIFNNIKIKYNSELFDINDFIPGYFRTTDITSTELNLALRQDFLVWTSLINDDYTKHSFFDRNNTFTFNYKSYTDPQNNQLPGFWRAVYKHFYDTDRPNTHPWEMLGYAIKPTWWESQYGPSPYTRDNLLLWTDLQDGIVREPGVLPKSIKKYTRPNLLKYLPVDEAGNLIDPLQAGVVTNYVSVYAEKEFTFGDQAPVETAWRRSSQYPFALITALTLLRPAKMFATCFDRERQYRDGTGQIVYKMPAGNLRFNTTNLVFPSTVKESEDRFTSGLINYLTDYAISKSFDIFDDYKTDLLSLQVKIASKLAGFTTKEKFKLILDSRSPLNQGNVFIPQENYDIILNNSTPVVSVTYSGVIVEKQSSGFIIKGYNKVLPEFKYKTPLTTASDPVINVGGISESFVNWESGKYYSKGLIVRNDQNYFRTTVSHTSSTSFELKYFSKLASLPIVGGREVIIRRQFSDELSTLHYGAELRTIQDVVDFLLGYGEYLKDLGFVFESYNPVVKTVTDWQTSAKEFAFWTTQNWSAGAIITLSPAAEEIIYKRPYAVVDSIYDPFYEYTIFKQDGFVLEPSFTNTIREDNSFSLRPKNTADGLYHVTLHLVQKEHVLILDDVTVFNDIIYDQTQGYRQDRIKVVGYKISNWNGDFNIPGFVYDRAVTSEWKSWKDYALGETVKYKEFYYSARKNISGAETFNDDEWYRLDGKPESKLIPNWDYRATQFEDFYDLDTDSFDVDQQKFAQHLIGYQKRQYLENIINDDVSQYKFYQGMIQEKGTQNSLLKLFDALNSANQDSLEFYEEWAIRLGQYGANGGFEEVEYILDEDKFLINPQPVELVSVVPPGVNDFVYRITKDSVYLQPDDYAHAPIPTLANKKEYIQTAGYVHLEDINHVISAKSDIGTYTLSELREGDYFWLGFDNSSWNVYRFTLFASAIRSFEETTNLRINLKTTVDSDIVVGEFIGIRNASTSVNGIKEVLAVGNSYIEVALPTDIDTEAILALNENLNINLFKFTSQRLKTTSTNVATIDDLNSLTLAKKKHGELVWIDGANNDWSVWRFSKSYTRTVSDSQENFFAKTMAVSDIETNFAAGGSNIVLYYSRPTSNFNWSFQDQLVPLTTGTFTATNGSFGESLSFNADGSYLFVGAPDYGVDVIPGPLPTDEPTIVPNYQGYVAQYTRNEYGTYVFTRVIQNTTPTDNEHFGHKTVVNGSVLFVAAKGSELVASSIVACNTSTGAVLGRVTYAANEEIRDINVSSSNVLVVSTKNLTTLAERVYVYTFITSTFTLIQTIDRTISALDPIATNTNFGQTVAISKNGTQIAIGVPGYSGANSNQGALVLLDKVGSTYSFSYLIKSPTQTESEQFGYKARFNLAGDRLAVYSYGGYQTIETLFNDGTTFDLGTTNFVEKEDFVGSVRVYEKYGTKFLFGDELEPQQVIGINYGDDMIVANSVYTNDYNNEQGYFYEFKGSTKSWTKYREPAPVVNLDKIKSIFLYDTVKNSIVTNLDFIDPINGKILGIAEQELSYKTYYDPAVYSIGTESIVVDELMAWESESIGRLWWDLSTIKFVNPNQGSVLYKANTWNNVFNGAEVDIYEWVQSEYSPEEWDSLADTETGLSLGISGTSKYGMFGYSLTQSFDTVSQTFKNVYYFWVKNKTTVPEIDSRNISASDVAELIANPKNKGISYVTLLGSNQFALVNCKELIADKNVAINIRYWTIDKTDANIHSHYQLLAEGNTDKKLNKYIEQKWFDSLVGYDSQGRAVPDPTLPAKLKYGVLSKPRQGMFINRLEALKQFIERVNSVLIDNLIIDDFDFEILNLKEAEPSEFTGLYDIAIDSQSQIRFVGSTGFIQASATAIVEDGKIIRVVVTNPGRGYKISPAITITSSTGTGARLTAVLNTVGAITSVTVDNAGRDYQDATFLEIRPFTVLVKNDETAAGKWAMYTWNTGLNDWFRSRTQVYDVTKHWNYVDWYATGYSAFTRVDHLIDFAYEMSFNNIALGDLVKIKNEKSGGWILLERINTLDTDNVSLNYKTVGRQNGTIQFSSNLYQFKDSNVGFDSTSFDKDVYDDEPKEELKYILACIKDNLLIDDLEIEYNKLFFSSLRYVFSEQGFVDWAFKTSFVKSKHNLGELQQKVNYKSDNLASYEEYINEVKPYRTKVREFISNYSATDNTNSATSDFDLPAKYNTSEGKILPFLVKVKNSAIDYISPDILKEPYSDWLDNVGYQIVEIRIVDGGAGYQGAPQVDVVGICKTKAVARAYTSQGAVSKIVVEIAGTGYLTVPQVVINGSVGTTGRVATAVAILGNSLVRTNNIGIKFDRIASTYTVSNITVTQQFTGTGSKTRFELQWPLDLKTDKTAVFIGNEELLSSDYEVSNELDTSVDYTRYKGVLVLTTAAALNTVIRINYSKDIRLLDAADRIQYYYDPKVGQLGKDLGQLMQGVDYGGVEVTGLSFDLGAGWDGLPWFTSGWDDFDTEYTDHLVISDGVIRSFTLPYIPANGEQINTYLNGVRLDDPNYDNFVSLQTIYDDLVAELAVAVADEVLAQSTYDTAVADLAQLVLDRQDLQDTYDGIDATYNPDSGAESDPDRPWAQPGGPTPFNLTLENQLAQLLDDIATLSSQIVAQTTVRNNAQTALTQAEADIVAKQSEVDDALVDLNAAPAVVNVDAQMNTYYGNGVAAGPIVIPVGVTLVDGDTIIFRKSTSDGSFKPNEKFYDSEIIGGLPDSITGGMTYNTARGITSEEIIIDGDNFVTATSSHAPEEVVTGQVVDSVAITVYDKVSDGAPVILTRHFIANGSTKNFNIGQAPNSTQAAFVKVNGLIKTQDVDYVLNYETQVIEFPSNLDKNTQVVITSMSRNGINVIDADSFVGDGTTAEFVTIARWSGEYSVVVTVDGEPVEVTTFITDNSYNEIGNIGIIFATAPELNAVIDYTVLNTEVSTISFMRSETIVHNGTDDSYILTRVPANLLPFENNIIVKYEGKVLRPADTVYFTVAGTARTYTVNQGDYAINTIDTSDIRVYLNGVQLSVSVDYTWVSTSNQLKIKRGVANTGDEIALVIVKNAEYITEPNGSDIQLTLFDSYIADEQFIVTTFTNHDILEIERNNNFVRSASTLTVGSTEYYIVNQLLSGRIKLRTSTVSASYVWLTLNGELLTPEIDYILEDNLEYIQIDENRLLLDTDVVEVLVFNSRYTKQSFGYRIFKDMLNRTFYKRIDDSISTKLYQSLNYYDTSIVVEDASGLLEPLRSTNQSGIVVINGERIEYLEKDGNTLRYLRRGTGGTGVPTVHLAGSIVRDQSPTQTIPYKDETETVVLVADGYTVSSTEYENSEGMSVTSVTYSSNNNTAFPLGGAPIPSIGFPGQVATVIGTGFKTNVKAIVGNVECATTYVSATQLTFIPPGNTVGAYDLVILNPAVIVGSTTIPATSVVSPGAIKYVQILLPFAPQPDPRSATNWFKDLTEMSVTKIIPGRYYKVKSLGNTTWSSVGATTTIGSDFRATAIGTGTGTVYDYSSIPYEYWEGMDIEVFIGGKRLRKSPITVWDESIGPDSPSGDVTLEAEFAVNKNVGAYVRLTDVPMKGSKIIVQKKTGQLWSPEGVGLADSQSDQAKFIRAGIANLPGKGTINTVGTGELILTTEDGSSIDNEDGTPLIWN